MILRNIEQVDAFFGGYKGTDFNWKCSNKKIALSVAGAV
jgi:hypothetical protein